MAKTSTRRINIALQGGGAHGAFTWGVLDRLLRDDRLDIRGISGTSAGAMNAMALAEGLATGGRARAVALLEEFWTRVSEKALASPIRRGFWDRLFGRWSLDHSPGYQWSQQVSRVLSPYQFNPFDFNPLREVVSEVFGFDAVNADTDHRLFVSATNVRTGRAKVFRQPEVTVDTLMASACLPAMFKAVEIGGEAYWDGGYIGNPALFPLIDETPDQDIVIVQVNPFNRPDVPDTAPEIENRLNEITFNAALMKELRAIEFLMDAIGETEPERATRLHLIEAEDRMLEFSVSSKLNAERDFLEHLRAIGAEAAERWLAAHFDDLGERTSWRPGFVFEECLKPARCK